MKEISTGQVWSYHSRKSERSSKVTVFAVDQKDDQNIVHVKVEGLKIVSPRGIYFGDTIEHLPINKEIFLKCVVEIIGKISIELPEGYYYWKSEFEQNKAGVWNIELIDIINSIESTMH